MRPSVAKALACNYDVVPIEAAVQGLRADAGAAVQGSAARRHRGESAGARARHHPDGGLQQVRPDGGDDRQQVGDVGRLRHALRRHERRLQSGEGPLQDRGLPAGAAAQPLEARRRARAGRSRDPGATSSRARRPRSCARTRPTRIRCRPTTRSTRSSSGWSSARSRSRRSSRPASTRRRWRGSRACSTSPNTSAASRRRA